ncbi:hypothetical protein M9458_048576, partial [Cirrhinus mrigala]
PPFEPIEDPIRIVTSLLRSSSLLCLLSKRVGDLQALSVAPSYLDFVPFVAKAFLYPRAGYVPKVPSSAPRPVVLQAFCPPPFREPDQQKLNCEHWTHTSTELPCGEGQTSCLFAMVPLRRVFLPPSPLASLRHGGQGSYDPKYGGLHAFLAGVPMQDICNDAGWSTPLTIVRFYDLDLRAAPGSS